MTEIKKKRWIISLVIITILLLGVVITMLLTLKPMPVALISEYNMGTLWEEGKVMNECAECHNPADFHTCETCHDDHGAVELENIPFSKIVELTGDVPDPSFVRIYQVIPDQENLGTHITLFQFLEIHGVDDFESVTFTTNDGGITTIERRYLDDTALLVPYIDGVRFITESVHSSTWLKGISRITIVGEENPLTIDGKSTSIGRLLLGETIRVTVEGSEVMLTGEDGETSRAFVANWAEGPRLLSLLEDPSPESVVVTDSEGNEVELSYVEIQNAIIAIIRDEVTLVLPERGRSIWPTKIVKIESN
jgi:hypothetical protein